MDREQRRQLLRDTLAEAHEIFKKPQPPDELDGPHNQREGVVKALCAALTFLKGEGVGADLNMPLIVLLGAIGDIDDGISNPLLERPKRKSGRPPVRHLRQANMATASAVVTLLMQTGLTEEDAASKVARKLPDVSAATLKGWRDKRHEKGEVARQIYDICLRNWGHGTLETAAKGAELLLDLLALQTQKLPKPPL